MNQMAVWWEVAFMIMLAVWLCFPCNFMLCMFYFSVCRQWGWELAVGGTGVGGWQCHLDYHSQNSSHWSTSCWYFHHPPPSFLPPSHNALWWGPGPPDVPACLHSGPCLMWQRAWLGSAMAIKMNERSVKWQLCYDVTARTWWMVSEVLLFTL